MNRVLRSWLAAALLLLALPAWGAESAAVRSARATATLVADSSAIAAGEPFRLALRLRLAPGWHSYWRNPGDAGAPTELNLALPDGAVAGPVAWPAPQRIPTGPLVSFGYTGEVLLPMSVQPGSASGDFVVEADATWLVCAEVCVPEEGHFRLVLPVRGAAVPDGALAVRFAAAEAATPRPAPWAASASLSLTAGELRLTGPEFIAGAVREAFFFPAEPGALDSAAAQPVRAGGGVLTLALTRSADAVWPERLAGVLTIVDGAGIRAAYEISAPVAAAAASTLGFWPAVAAALLGGLLLNLMPCVFPILAMKALALARLAGAARGEVRRDAAATVAGILATFLALGGGLLALRAGGAAVGWGFQFTAPGFVAAMAWLMLAVGLNLSGVFAVAGPVVGGGRGGAFGSFLSGALAVLVAAPCTAPFMAAALGAALALEWPAALGVFVALGAGLAAPYALLAAAPGLIRVLPRPGAWMERLRQFLAFPMYGAAAWLVWVLAQQVGPDGLLAVLAGAVLVAFSGWALGVAQQSRRPGVGRGAAALALLVALALLPRLSGGEPPALAAEGEPWSASRVAMLQAEGRPVFVNLTAAWCISCKVNERIALRSDAVRQGFAARNVASLTGDWTRGDAVIAGLLREHGRDGVPLYLLYPAGGGAARILPELLTEGIVLRALAALPG